MYTLLPAVVQQRRPVHTEAFQRNDRPRKEVCAVEFDQQDIHDVIQPPEPRRRATYIRVVVVELIVLLALWALSRAFSG